MLRKLYFFLAAALMLLSFGESMATDRALEIKGEMWNSADKDFKATTVPDKWKDKSAIIIAQLHRFEYKKAVMANLLKVNQYSHYRIKLNDQNAISKYAEISYNADDDGYGNT